MGQDLKSFQVILGYDFQNISLLKEALTHRSFATERKLNYDNQRLEFLGDAVLEIVISKYLFNRYPKEQEGVLTKMRSAIVQEDALATLANNLNLGKFVSLGKGEQTLKGYERPALLADAFEATFGAIYLDGGFEIAHSILIPLIELIFPDPKRLIYEINPKGALQELSLQKYKISPTYDLVTVEGPDHNPIYKVKVEIENIISAEGSGTKKKMAEFEAAKKALDIIQK